MFNRRLFCSLVILCVLTEQFVFGNSASPLPVEVTQPSGEKIMLYVRGNEKINWYEFVPEAADVRRNVPMTAAEAEQAATPGYTVMKDANGRYVYAQLGADSEWTPTDIVVGVDPVPNVERRLIPPPENIQRVVQSRLPDQNIPSRGAAPVGTVKNLVVLLRFSDHTNRQLPTRDQFDQLFNSPTPVANIAPTGSVKTFYQENSYGKMNLESTVVDWVTLPKTEAYYANSRSGLSTRTWEALRAGLNIIRSGGTVDFAEFDNENGGTGDGWIDAITFVHSGYAAEFGGVAGGADKEDRIWSHRWAMATWTDTASGVKVSDYNINPGVWGTSGNAIGRIGVICHELGHFFGLPDLYDYSGKGEGCGSWCLMANSWGFDGTQHHPPHLSAWCKVALSWNTAKPLSDPGVYKLKPTATSDATIYRVDYPGSSSSEYLLIENRQAIGEYDGGIPAGAGGKGGLAIWHIDDAIPENDRPGYPGSTGYPGEHYKVGLIQADGLWELEKGINRGNANDVYRKGNNDALTSSSNPKSDSFTGIQIPPITKISDSGNEMSFQFGDVVSPPPVDTVLAGKVEVETPTSHAVNFSNDAKAATILLDQLYAYSLGVEVKHATFVLPLKDATGSSKVQIHVRGYVNSEEGSSAQVIIAANGTSAIFDPKDHPSTAAPPVKGATKGNEPQTPDRATVAKTRGVMNPRAATAQNHDFFYELQGNINKDEKLPITIIVRSERSKKDSGGTYVVVDAIDVEISP